MNHLRTIFFLAFIAIAALILIQPDHSAYAAINPVIISGGATGVPGPPGPSGAPGSGASPNAQTLCAYGQKLTEDSGDEFSSDFTLNISATPSSAGTGPNASFTSMWSDELYFGRTNNAGTDTAFYPSEGANLAGTGGYIPSWLNDGTVASPWPIALKTPSAVGANDGYLEISAQPVNLTSHGGSLILQNITSTGSQTVNVSPGSGTIFAGRTVLVDPSNPGTSNENVVITGTTANTITATFTKTHTGYGTPGSGNNGGISIGDPTLCAANPCRQWLGGTISAAPVGPYGYTEFAAQIPSTQGAWPALWLVCAAGCVATNSTEESDIVEYFGGVFPCNQFTSYNNNYSNFGAANTSSSDYQYLVQQTFQVSYAAGTSVYSRSCVTGMDTRWHTYGVLQIPNPKGTSSPGFAQFFVDRQPTSSFFPMTGTYPQTPIINFQVYCPSGSYVCPGGTYVPGPPSSVANMTMTVRYYRHYAYASPGPTPAPAVTGSPPLVSQPNQNLNACGPNDLGGNTGNQFAILPPTPQPSVVVTPTPSPTPSVTPTPNALLAYMQSLPTPLVLYPLQETAGSTAVNDASGGNYNGTVGSGVTLGSSAIQSGFTNVSYLFPQNGTGGSGSNPAEVYYSPVTSALQPSPNYSVGVWFKFASIYTNNEAMVVYGNEYNTPTFRLWFPTSGSNVLKATVAEGSGPTVYTLSSATLTANTEYFALLTVNSTTATLWINPTTCTPAATQTFTSNTPFYNTGNTGFALGQDVFGVDNSFNGNENYFGFWGATLTCAQAEALYSYH